MKPFRNFIVLITSLAVLALFGCDQSQPPQSSPNQQAVPSPSPVGSLSIVSGSENSTLEPLLQQFAQQQSIGISIKYMGSVDISLELAKGVGSQFDAIWPASGLWLSLGDKQGVVKNAKSIMRSPVVFAVKKSIASKLGWDKKDVTVMEILEAVEKGNVRFAMTSATQSNSGTSAFLAFLSAFAGGPEVLTNEHLNDPKAADKIKRFLRSVNRSSGSSGWLKDMLLKEYLYYDGMVNYEAMVIEFNRQLPPGQEPLYAVYPVDGISIADSPLGFIAKGDAAKEAVFAKLQEYLLSPAVQDSIQAQGRRTGLIGMEADPAKAAALNAVFNPDWGINLSRILTPIRIPAAPVVSEALNLYQTAFRKPSLTAYVLDYSGSMAGTGVEQLRKAMRTLLDQRIAKEYLLQASPEDMTIIVPFNSGVMPSFEAKGNDPQVLGELLAKVEALEPGGGTNMYVGAAEAMKQMKLLAESGTYHSSVIVMSDGMSEGSLNQFQTLIGGTNMGKDVPVFTILFGDAKPEQMKAFAEAMSGRMFDGRKDVVQAFREAKGYN
ncbi:MAG: Ca-activated chloride channel family protein [Candidatus Electronema aureum]|uniref:Ca-activated chloride channel family protein n=1 Tax=Candidatus Electronema aureum TaxID=2005002 RepID=A0A521G0K3_9BACT|nr:MAG: Ca-activated chloride channel family protein [Candidatus Electronema aureum]